MIIEMRTYKTKPGRRADFLEVFRSRSIPAHTEIGMKILGPFLPSRILILSFLCVVFPIWLHVSR
jgi:hypothetical protein